MWMMVAFVLGEVAAYQNGMTAWSIFIAVLALLSALAIFEAAKERVNSDFQEDKKCLITLENPYICRGLLLLFCFLMGWGRMSAEMRPDALEQYVKENDGLAYVSLSGTIDSFSEKNGRCTMILTDVYINPDTEDTAERIKKVLVSFKGDLLTGKTIHSGNRTFLTGMAEFPEEASNLGQFSYRMYYRGLGIRNKVNAYQISVYEEKASPLKMQTERFGTYASGAFKAICADEDAGVFQAILLGDKSELSEKLKERFQDNGIAHILAVSGLHVSLIGMSLYGAMRYIGASYGMAGVCASALLTFYGFVTGFGASVFRAVFMVEVSCLAAYLGRSYDLLSALSLSLILQAWQSPYLLFSAGLQLSYGAVAAIGIETELMRERMRRLKELEDAEVEECNMVKKTKGHLRCKSWLNTVHETIMVSMAIQLYTMPVQLYHYFSFPLFGILLNLVVIPLLTYAAGSGILALGIYSIALAVLHFFADGGIGISGLSCLDGCKVIYLPQMLKMVARACTGPGHYIFKCYEWLCIQAEKMPFHSVIPGRPTAIQIAVFYLLLLIRYVYVMEKWGNRLKRKTADMTFMGAAILLLMINPVRGLHVWFLDVGQGDGVFIRTRCAAILSDCGSSQDKKIGKNVLIPFLKSQGINKLDWILVSHADADHINGIEWLLTEESDIRVDNLALPAVGKGQEVYEKIEKLAKSRGAGVYYLKRGAKIQAEDLTLNCIHPDKNENATEDRNSHSLVFDVTYGDFSMLLTGDIGADEERQILLMEENEKSAENVTLLKAAHHGSAGSSSEDFLEYYLPDFTVLSYGEGNTYGHPAPEAVERLEDTGTRLLRTAKSGAIHVWTDGRDLKITDFKDGVLSSEKE